MTHNFTTAFRRFGLSLAGMALFHTGSFAQASMPHDPHDPVAYNAVSFHKGAGNAKPLLSTVHYVAQADTLIPYDSSWISYDAGEKRILEQLVFRWNGGQWVPFDRYTYSYDGNGFNDVTTYDFWNIVKGAFVPVVRYNYWHDASGNRTGLHYEVWQQASGSFINGLQESYTLDASGLRTQTMQQNWIPADAAWRNNTLESMGYNAQGKEDFYMMQYWDNNLNSWQQKREIRTVYNASGLTPLRSDENDWNRVTQHWDPKSRYMNTLNGDEIVTHTIEFYDGTTSAWIPSSRDTRSYLANGKTARTTLASWYAAGRVFQDAAQSTWTYTEDDQPSRVATLVQFHGKWSVAEGAKETIYYYKADPGELNIASHSTAKPLLTLSPVPANSSLDVRLSGASTGQARLQITDMSGRAVIDRAIEATGTQLDVSAIPAGVYNVRVQGAKGEQLSDRFSIAR